MLLAVSLITGSLNGFSFPAYATEGDSKTVGIIKMEGISADSSETGISPDAVSVDTLSRDALSENGEENPSEKSVSDNESANEVSADVIDNTTVSEENAGLAQYPIWVGNNRVTANNKDDVLGDGGSVKYDPVNKILILTDFEGCGYIDYLNKDIYHPDKNGYAMIYIEMADVKVVGNTKGKITAPPTPVATDYQAFISGFRGKLTLDADLTLEGFKEGIDIDQGEIVVEGGKYSFSDMPLYGFVSKNIRVDSGEIELTKGTFGFCADDFNGGYGNFTLNGGDIKINNTVGIYGGSISVNGGKLDLECSTGIECDFWGDTTVNGGEIRLKGKKGYRSYNHDSKSNDDGYLIVSGGSISFDCEKATEFFCSKKAVVVTASNMALKPDDIQLSDNGKSFVKNGQIVNKFQIYDSEKYGPAYYDVSFNMLGHGNPVSSDWVEKGKAASRPTPDPSETGYEFKGWFADQACTVLYDFNAPVTRDIVLFAGWRVIPKYTVTFSLNGKPGAAPVSQNRYEGEKVSKPSDPTAEGFRFMGWFRDPACEEIYDFDAPIMSNFTLYAKWVGKDVKTYTVKFDLNGHGSKAPADQTVEENGTAKWPNNPTADGWLFKGWYTDKEGKSLYDFADPVTADITLYARWEEDVPPGAFKIFYTDSALAFDSYKGLTYNTENEHYEWTYTGSALKPAVTVTDHKGNVLTEGSDYTVKYSGNKDVSAKPAKVTVTGKGNYAGSRSLDFYILKADLGKAKAKKLLTVPDSFAVQKGKTIAATVIYRGNTIGSKDYKLSNTGKIKEDTTVDIEGIGNNFTGKISGIPVKALEAKEIREKTIKVELKADKHTYNGSAQELTDAELKVSAGNPGTPLSKGKDYRVIYGSNTDAGKAKVTVIALGDYVGTVSKTFVIDPDISSAVTVTLRDGTSAGFDPKGAKPALVVKTDKLTLTAGKDYKAAYSNNTAKGEGAYKLTFLGNFKGHKAYTGKFAITEAAFASASVNAADLIYSKPNSYRSSPFVSVGGVMVDKKNYTVKYFDGTKELAAKDKITLGDGETERVITIKATGRNNYKEEESAAFTYRVMKVSGNMINLSKAKIVGRDTTKAVKKQEYTGSAVTPEIDVLIKQGKEWVKVDPADYTVTYINNINKGKAVILVSGKGTNAAGSKTAKFTIKAKSMSKFN